ncbi:MAG TPA: ferritin family protein [Dehalococcoidia bacterium]|jgi:acyl-CoA hydrolase/ferritin
MRLKGSKTEDALRKAFAREVHVDSVYTYFASAARKAGLDQIADIFWATAQNEAEHAEHEYRFLGGGGDTEANLKLALGREHEEAAKLYPEAAQIAEEEGFSEIAAFFRRMGAVEKRHEETFKQLIEVWREKRELNGKTVGHSAVDMAELMLPHHSNPAGVVHGGELMKMMDNAAGVAAARHSQANPVTGMVHDIRFLSPVHVGEVVLIHARLTFVGHTSMEVRVEIDAQNLGTEERRQAMTAHYIMVATDSKGKPVDVPPLIVITEEEERLFTEGLARYQALKKQAKK